MSFRIEQTKDGSPTIFSEKFQTTYHSVHGAMQESLHVFIRNGFEFATQHFSEINILEVGFGTGLNAILTLQSPFADAVKVNYTAVEKYPLPAELYSELSYFGDKNLNEQLQDLHKQEWNSPVKISDQFLFEKARGDIHDLAFNRKFNLVYYDAFGPLSQKEMWAEEIFRKLYDAMDPKGILVTFCAQGDFKRKLRALGFKVEALPGAPGKREMTRAIKRIAGSQ